MTPHSAFRLPRFLWLLIATLLVAAFLRLWQIGTLPPGLHYDEAADTIIAEQIVRGENAPIFVEAYTGKEVLFFYWAAAWMKLIGPSAFAMRLAAAMLGVLTVAATYRAVREMFDPHPQPLSLAASRPAATRAREGQGRAQAWGAEGVTLLATIFIATSFWHVLMSRLGFRSISEPLIQALALAALFRGLRTNRWRWFFIAGALIGLNLYTYLAARLFPVAIALIFLYYLALDRGRRLDRLTQFLVTTASALIVFAPLGMYFLQHPDAFLTRIQQVAPRADQATSLIENIGRALGVFFIDGDPYIRFNLPGRPLFPWLLGALFLIGLVVILVGMLHGRTLHRRAAYFSLIALTLIMLLPTALAVNEITPSNLRAIGLMPTVFVFPALGAWQLIKAIGTRMNTDEHRFCGFICGICVHLRSIVFLVLAVTAAETGIVYFGQYVNEPQLYVQSDGDLADIAAVLNHSDSERIYIAARHYRHPTIAALAENYGAYKWLSGNRVVVLPDKPADLFFARLAQPDEMWLKRFLPDSTLMAAPIAPDGRTNYRAYHLTSQPVVTPQVKLDVNFGNIIQLLGYDREPDQPTSVTLYWRVLNPPDRGDYSTFAQLRDRWGFEWGQTGSFDYPSEEWSPGEIIINRLDVPIAAGVPPGDYELRLGLFSQSANARLNIVAADDDFGGTVARLSPLSIESVATDAVQLNIGTRLDREVRPGLKLLGYSQETTSAKQGAPIIFTLFWQSTALLTADRVSIQLVSCGCTLEPKTTTTLTTTAPVHGTYPFDRWPVGAIVADRYRLRSPIDESSGDYTLAVAIGADQPIELGTINLYTGDRVVNEPPIDHRLDEKFGDAIELAGYNLDRADGAIKLTLIWRVLKLIDQDYTVFTHALNETGQVIGGQDNQPLKGAYPTSWWIPGEYVIDSYEIKAPSPVAAIEVGLYDPETGARLGSTQYLK